MEALEDEVSKSGQDFEDFKTQIRDQLLTQELIRKEVGSQIIISHEDVVKYYNEHKSDFVRPETVVLREIFVSTEGKPAADIPALRKKADNLRDRVLNNGDDFGEMAKHYSDSPTAQQEGELGSFQRSQLDPKIAEKVFALNRNQMTDVIETKTGFEILQVEERYDAGEQPLDKVEPEITNKLYEQKMEPALRDVPGDAARRQLHPDQAGYIDTAAVKSDPIEEVAATPEKDDSKKKSGKKWGFFQRRNRGHETKLRFDPPGRTRTLPPTFLSVKRKFAPRAKASPTCAWSWATPPAVSRRACGTVSTKWRPPSNATIS